MIGLIVTCHGCGEVRLSPECIRVWACTNADRSHYAFCCPLCGVDRRRPADRYVIGLLRDQGVKVFFWELPLEALERHAGPPLGPDDLLDLGVALCREDYLAEKAIYDPHAPNSYSVTEREG